MTAQPLLDVNDLTVEFATRRGIVKAVQHVNITVAKGETLGIVGELYPPCPRTRSPSKLAKKNVLFLKIGPPTLKPY